MGITEDDKAVLDGILLHAEKNMLALIHATRRETGEEVILLCCNEVNGNALRIVPVAEIVLGVDIGETYVLPDELAAIAKPFNSKALEVGTSGVDKP